jgi:hypothetical protein
MKIPKVLGLTASQINKKTENPNRDELEDVLQTLADNFYSKFIRIDKKEMDLIKNEATVEIEK